MAIRQTAGGDLRQLADRIAGISGDNFRQDLDRALMDAGERELKREFATGTNPYGESWAPLRHGHRIPFSKSRRFSGTFGFYPSTTGGFRVESRGKAPLAHQEGATIPARHAGGQEMYFSPRSGKLLRSSRARRLKLVYVSQTRHHHIGEIVLPERMLLPRGGSGGAGPLWGESFKRAAQKVMREQVMGG